MDRSPTSNNGARSHRRLPEWEKWICDSCLDESHYIQSPDKERYVAAGLFWVRQQRTGEPFYCPGHVGITPWASFSPDARTVCTSDKPTHTDHILSVLKPSSRCSVRKEEGSMPKWLTAASVAGKASQGSVQSHSLHVGCVYMGIDNSSLNNGRRPPASSAYPVVPQISSAPFP
jgi:hypothetical protein